VFCKALHRYLCSLGLIPTVKVCGGLGTLQAPLGSIQILTFTLYQPSLQTNMLRLVNTRRAHISSPVTDLRSPSLRTANTRPVLHRPSFKPSTCPTNFKSWFTTATSPIKAGKQYGPSISKHRHFKRRPLHKLHSTKFKPITEYNAKLQQAVDGNDVNSVVQILEEVDQKNIIFTMDTFHLLIKFAIKQRNEDILDEVKGLMAVCQLRANETTYKLFIDYYTQANDALALEDAKHKLQDYLFAKQHLPELVSGKKWVEYISSLWIHRQCYQYWAYQVQYEKWLEASGVEAGFFKFSSIPALSADAEPSYCFNYKTHYLTVIRVLTQAMTYATKANSPSISCAIINIT